MPIAAHPFRHWRRFDVGPPPYYPKTEMPASDRTCGPWRRKDEMKNQDPLLTELQAADLTLQLAGKETPRGYRSPLDMRKFGYRELSSEAIDHALAMAVLVDQIKPIKARRCVSCAMAVERGAPKYDRRELAVLMGLSERSVSRLISLGLQHIRISRNNITKLPEMVNRKPLANMARI
jgi:hypothetical protein